jgi:hypothetical protein
MSERKPFIYTYFKQVPIGFDDSTAEAKSLKAFKEKLSGLGHFYSRYIDTTDLWNQFNKELERLDAEGFARNARPDSEGVGKTYVQKAEKIYNIEKIDKADFS